MKKIIVVACFCVLVFCSGWVFGQRTLDASNWSELGKIDKLRLIERLTESVATSLTRCPTTNSNSAGQITC
jgi:hypothetical protein